MPSHSVVISFTASGVPVVVRSVTSIGQAAGQSATSLGVLRQALGFIGSAVTIKGILEAADSMTTIRNRLGFVSKSAEEAAVVQEQLLDVANRSRSSFEATAELYSRVALSSSQLKLSHEQLARVTETLNKAVILSGANTKEAEAAIIQFSQGLAQGALRGQEMRSVMQQIPFVADLIAQRLGVDRGALRDLGAQGKVTAQVMIDALLGASGKVDGAFGKTIPTLEQSLEVLKNHMLAFVDTVNQKFGLVPKITAVLDFLGEHMETIGRVILAGVFVYGVTQAIGALSALTAAIAANPLGLLAVLITAAVALLVLFSDQIKLTGDGAATLADFFAVAFDDIVATLKYMAGEFAKSTGFIGDAFRSVLGNDFSFTVKGFLVLVARLRDGFVGLIKGGIEVIKIAFTNLPLAIEVIFKAIINRIMDGIEFLINGIISGINSVITAEPLKTLGLDLNPLNALKLNRYEYSKEAEGMAVDAATAFKKAFNNETAGVDLVNQLSVKAEERAQARIKQQEADAARRRQGIAQFQAPGVADSSLKSQRDIALEEVIKRLNEEAEALQYVGRERTAHLQLIREEQSLRKKGITLTDDERAQLLTKYEEIQTLKLKGQILDEVDGKLEENARSQEVVNQLIKDGTGRTDLYIQKLQQLKYQALEQNRDVASGFQRGFLSVQDEVGNFAKLSEQTVTNAFHNMEDAFVDFVKTGKLSFSSLVDSMLADLTRLLFRQAVSGLFGSILGAVNPLGAAVGGVAGAAAGGARAAGGPVSPGKAYLVGENGPEIFSPHGSGSIVPTGVAGGPAPQVHVQVVNVQDPDEVTRALNHPQNQEVVVNVLRKNRTAVRAALGIA